MTHLELASSILDILSACGANSLDETIAYYDEGMDATYEEMVGQGFDFKGMDYQDFRYAWDCIKITR